MEFEIIRILFLGSLSFIVAMAATPVLTHFLFKYKMGKQIRDAGDAPIMASMHQKKSGTPTMGGILIWGTVLLLALGLGLLNYVTGNETIGNFNFLSRSETWLPLGMFFFAAMVGLVDDWMNVKRLGPKGGGLSMKHKLLLFGLIASVGAYWFFFKLGWDLLHVPFVGTFSIGAWYIPYFILVVVATGFSVNETDGLDGLAGGVLLTAFAAYGGIAFVQGRFDIATLCAVIGGALLAFLWFNINPARFFMGDTGSMSLGVVLAIIALLTNEALLLPIIGFVLVVETVSVLVQLFSKKVFKRKLFHSTPIHHHFEAVGWSEPKIVMRFWVIAIITSGMGYMLFLLDRGFF